MRVLVTRPRPDAEAFAEALTARGHEALIEPLLEITLAEASALPSELDAFQALLVTSANGLRAFAALTDRRDLPVFAVGPASAEAAAAAGFARVESAEGDVDDLIRLVRARLSPDEGVLLHAAGKTLAGDLKGELEAAGFTVTRAVLYTAEAAIRLSDATQAALREGRVGAVALFSPRTAETFVALVREADLAEACRSLRALCLSAAVAGKLEALDWAALEVAARPETEALLAMLDRPESAAGAGTGDEKDEGMAEQDGAAAPDERPGGAAESAAVAVIGRFGGIRPMAQKLGIAVSTVQGWREREVIPKARHEQIRAAAAAGGIALPDEELDAAGQRPESASAPDSPAPAEASAPKPEAPRPGATERADPESEPAEASKPAVRSSMATAAASGPRPGPATVAAKAGGGWLFGFVIGALVFLGGLGIAVLSRETWLPLVGEPAVVAEPSPELLERLDALETALSAQEGAAGAEFAAEIDRLRSALSRVEAEVGAGASSSTKAQSTLSGLQSRLAGLDRRIAELSGGAAALADLRADVGQLAARLAEVEQRLAALPQADPDAGSALPPRVAVVLATAQLRDALRRPSPFERELASLAHLAADDAELSGVLDTLSPYAAAGIPTRERLRADFPQVARAVAAAGAGAGEEGWLAGVRRRLSDLVTVRPVGGDATGDSPGAVAARAEARVAAGDLAGALAELEQLSGRAAEAAAAWREAARARASAEDALRLLSGRIAGSLAPNLAAETPAAAAQEPASQSASEAPNETASETAEEMAPETEAETGPEAAKEAAPDTEPEAAPETAEKADTDPGSGAAGEPAPDPDSQ